MAKRWVFLGGTLLVVASWRIAADAASRPLTSLRRRKQQATAFSSSSPIKGMRKDRRQQDDSSDTFLYRNSPRRRRTKKNSDDEETMGKKTKASKSGKESKSSKGSKKKKDDSDEDIDDDDDEDDNDQDEAPDGDAVLQSLCDNDSAIYRTCISSDMAGVPMNLPSSIVLQRDEDDLLESVGRTPPSASSDAFTVSSDDLLLVFVGDEDLAAALEDCRTKLEVEQALLAYVMMEFDSSAAHYLCAAVTNVATSTVDAVTVTSLTTSLTVETMNNVLFSGTNCTAADLTQCCLQQSLNNETRAECAALECDTAACPAPQDATARRRQSETTPSDSHGRRHRRRRLQMSDACDTSEGLVGFLQCAVPGTFDTVVEAEVILGAPVETPVFTSACVATREAVRAVDDARTTCDTFVDSGCSGLTVELGFADFDTQCAAPEPETSTNITEPTPLCTLELTDEDFANFQVGEVLSITQGTDALYYMLSRIPGGTILTVLDIAARLLEDGTSVECSVFVADECTFAGQVVEKIAQAPVGKGGGTNLYIAGVDLAQDGSGSFDPFISRISGSSCRVKSANNTRNDFVLEIADAATTLSSALPFFDGLGLEPLRRSELWSASQTSLYADAPSDTLGSFQYFLTRFNVTTGMPTAEFKYFAETDLGMDEDPSFTLLSNELVDFLLLDDYGSFVTLELGQVAPRPEEAAPTEAPTSFPTFDFGATVAPTVMSMTFEPAATVTEEPTRAPVPLGTLPPDDPVYTTVAGPRSCLYRAYVDEVFVNVGIARKDLIRCYDQEITAITLVFNDLVEIPDEVEEEGRRLRRWAQREGIPNFDERVAAVSQALSSSSSSLANRSGGGGAHRRLDDIAAALSGNRQATDICLTDERALLTAGRSASGATTFDVRNFALLSNHFLNCADCTFVLSETVLFQLVVELALAGADLTSDIAQVDELLTAVLDAEAEADNFFAFTTRRGQRIINRNCDRLTRQVGSFEDAVVDCVDAGDNVCPVAEDLLEEWENRGLTIGLCCDGP